jgi:predicted secreted protein|tara:strand:+ start:169 stop:381 length:213 start_codon:yes stop_codon:yes gene_type:complete
LLTFLVIFVISWWLILFLVLPVGISKQKNVKFGNDPGAPNEPMLKKKFLITTIIALILTLIIIFIKNEVL